MNCQFSFGPNRSYFCSAGSIYAWSEKALPPALARVLEDSAHPQALQTPYDVSFPPQPGTYALCWKTKQGEDWFEDGRLGPHYARLARFIKNVATKGGYTTRTVFGPNGSFFSMSPSGFCWQNLPPDLEDDIHSCIKVRRPTTVALGAHGSYIVLYNDGNIVFDLRGQYPLVETMIRNTQEAARRRGVMYIALNPFVPGEFYAVYGDGSASWNFPTAWSADVIAVSRQIQAMPMPVPAPAPKPSVPPVVPAVEVALGGTGPPLPAPTLPEPAPMPAPMPAPITTSVPVTLTTTGGTASGTSSPAPTMPSAAPLTQTPTGSTISSTISGGTASSSPISGGTISGGTVSGGTVSGGTVSGGTVSGGTVSGGTVSGGAVSGSTVSGGTVSGGTTSGGSISGIGSAMEQAFTQDSTQPPPAYAPTAGGISGGTFAPAPAPVVQQASPLPKPPAQAPAHKMTWQEGLSMGFKAAKGLNKIVNAIQNPSQVVQNANQAIQNPGQAIQNANQVIQNANQIVQQQQQQQTTQGFDLSNLVANLPDLSNLQQQQQQGTQGLDLSNLVANLPDLSNLQQQGSGPVFDQVIVQETIFDNGNTTTVVDATTWQTS